MDPLDGTTNFAHGFPVFCVSIALVRARQLEVGLLYDPTRDEMFSAEHGKGAKLNGRPCMYQDKALTESLLGTGFPSHKRHKNPTPTSITSSPCALMDCVVPVRRARPREVAAGRYDGFWEFNLNPWDTAAGVLLVREAGGTVTRFDERPSA